jgi:hypothetical protein
MALDASMGRERGLDGREGPGSERKPAFQCEPEIEFIAQTEVALINERSL